jgi:hypothetical protein
MTLISPILGGDPTSVHLTGCPSIDLVARVDLTLPNDLMTRLRRSWSESRFHPAVSDRSPHPVTTEYGEGFRQINETLKAVVATERRRCGSGPTSIPALTTSPKVFARSGRRITRVLFTSSGSLPLRITPRSSTTVRAWSGTRVARCARGHFSLSPRSTFGTRQTKREHGPMSSMWATTVMRFSVPSGNRSVMASPEEPAVRRWESGPENRRDSGFRAAQDSKTLSPMREGEMGD